MDGEIQSYKNFYYLFKKIGMWGCEVFVYSSEVSGSMRGLSKRLNTFDWSKGLHL